uniref:serine/threonine protein kinase n=1 Tax=Alistipes sp. TaxID=1872444 RepID=UPI0040560FD6
MQLQPGTLLKAGSYRIIRTLGRGGFGITYLAEQVMVRRQVCVKEFFPKDYYKRDGDTRNITLSSDGFGQMMDKFKTKFLKEAQIIAGLDHPNIIRIHDVFEENGTAYYVMEYIEGESLQSIVSRRGALGRDEAVGYIEQLAAALGYIHAHDIAHLDVKPGNVMVRSKDDRALLIDFGLSKHYDSEGMQTSSTPLGISHGFAPIEQYQVGGVSTFSPRTDIYSMGATLYYLAMGKVPPAAANVGEDGLDELPSHFGAGVCTAIERSMQYRRKDRPASAEEFMSLVRGGGQTTFVDGPKRDEVQRREPQRDPRPESRPSKPEGDEPKKSKWWLWLLLAVVGVICGIALIGGEE